MSTFWPIELSGEFFNLQGSYAASGCLKPTFRDYRSVTSSMVKLDSSEMSVSNYLITRNNPEDGRIQFNRGGSLRSRNS